MSLALIKRYTELVIMRNTMGEDARAREYLVSDGELLAAMGTASGYVAVLVLALYITSDTARVLYRSRQLIWLLCPLLFYWISHMWSRAHRGAMHHDPLVFALKDRISQILIVLMVIVAVLAI